MTTGILAYNGSNDRYGLLVCDLWHIEGLKVRLSDSDL